jgi:hypothetical protein
MMKMAGKRVVATGFRTINMIINHLSKNGPSKSCFHMTRNNIALNIYLRGNVPIQGDIVGDGAPSVFAADELFIFTRKFHTT